MKKILVAGLIALGSAVSFNASALPITYFGSGTGPGEVAVSASAVFDIVGNYLTITLANTSPENSGKDVDGSTLTGVFWNFSGNPTLVPISATVAAGSIIGTCSLTTNCASVVDVGGEFGYQATALPGGADRGISSSGYLTTGLTKNIGNFNTGAAGINLDGNESLNGINFGIISTAEGYNPNGGMVEVPVVKGAVTFVLTGVSGLTNDSISNVSFQYGTSLDALNIPGNTEKGTDGEGSKVPEPATVALFGLGLLGFAAARRKAAQKKSA